MDGPLVIGAAIGVGVVVYALSLRAPDQSLNDCLGFGREPAPLDASSESESSLYVQVLPATELDWRTRIGGVVGLLLVVIAAALVVALGINQLGHALNQTIQGLVGQ
jgi:hypothetical protein